MAMIKCNLWNLIIQSHTVVNEHSRVILYERQVAHRKQRHNDSDEIIDD